MNTILNGSSFPQHRIMNTKTCTTCKEGKGLSSFSKSNSTKDKLYSLCKPCDKVRKTASDQTLFGLISDIYRSQKKSSKSRGHHAPTYTKSELVNWFVQQPTLHQLFTAWKASGHEKDLRPSVDRLDNSKGYFFDNIQLTDWATNNRLGNESRRKITVQ